MYAHCLYIHTLTIYINICTIHTHTVGTYIHALPVCTYAQCRYMCIHTLSVHTCMYTLSVHTYVLTLSVFTAASLSLLPKRLLHPKLQFRGRGLGVWLVCQLSHYHSQTPGHHGNFSASIPLIVNQNVAQPYRLLELSAEVLPGTISVNPAHVVLQPVPLEVSLSAQFYVSVQNFAG